MYVLLKRRIRRLCCSQSLNLPISLRRALIELRTQQIERSVNRQTLEVAQSIYMTTIFNRISRLLFIDLYVLLKRKIRRLCCSQSLNFQISLRSALIELRTQQIERSTHRQNLEVAHTHMLRCSVFVWRLVHEKSHSIERLVRSSRVVVNGYA